MRDLDFEGLMFRTLRISSYPLVFFCLILVLRPQDPIFWGFVVGTAVSMWNTFFLGKKLRNIAEMHVESAKAQVIGGVAMRFIANIAILFLAAMTGWFNIYTTMVGLFIVPCIFTLGTAGLLIGEAREAKAFK